MRTTWNTVWKFYLRNTALVLITAVVLCSFLVIPFLYPSERSPLFVLDRSVQFNFIYFSVFALLSYEIGTNLIDDPDTEATKAIPRSSQKIAISCALLLSAILFAMSALQCAAFAIRFALDGLLEARFFLHIIRVIILYSLLPGVMGMAAGSAFSGNQRIVSYLLIILFTMIFSPMMSYLAPERIIGIESRLDEWVRIFPGAELMWGDFLYGIPIETCRWVILLFWISLFLVLRFSRKEYLYRKGGRICLVLAFLAAVSCGIRFYFRGNDSIVDAVSKHGMLYTDADFYDTWREKESAAGFSVASYKMSLSFKNNLRASVEVFPEEESRNREDYAFTLYHGLTVQSVTSETGEEIPFTRNGDWLDIDPPGRITSVIIEYTGQTGRHYANRQGVFLPGYFAYYPIPGHQNMWDRVQNRFLPIANSRISEFEIKLKDAQNTICNLPRIDKDTFYGKSVSATLIRGFFSQKAEQDLTVSYLPLMKGDFIYNREEFQSVWNEMCDLLNISDNCVGEIDAISLLPGAFMTDSYYERAFLQDNLLLYAGMEPVMDYNQISSRILMQNVKWDESRALLIQLFQRELIGGNLSAAEAKQKPTYESLLPLILSSGHPDSIDSKALGKAENAFRELFYYEMDLIGRERFMPEVYQYLLTDQSSPHPADFLLRLEEQRKR